MRGETLLIHRGRQSGKTTAFARAGDRAAERGLGGGGCAQREVIEDLSLYGPFRHTSKGRTTLRIHCRVPAPAEPDRAPVVTVLSVPRRGPEAPWLKKRPDARCRVRRLAPQADDFDPAAASARRCPRQTTAVRACAVLLRKDHVRDLRDEPRPTGDDAWLAVECRAAGIAGPAAA